MNYTVLSVLLSTLLLSSGCSSMKKSLTFGVSTGAAVGAGSGAAMSRNDKGKGALKGALVGGLVGGIASYLIHGSIEGRDAKVRKETLFNLDQYGVSGAAQGLPERVPGITFPVETEEMIPTHRQGNRVIEGHRVWTLEDNAKFEKTIPKKKAK